MSDVKDKMIAIATETAQKAGVRAITMRDLGDAVGIKSSSVMYHFRNKDGLLRDIAASYYELFFQRLDGIENSRSTPLKRIYSLIDLFENALNADKMCLCGMLAAESAELDRTTQETTRRFFRRLEEWVAGQLRALDADPGLAPVMVSALEGAMLLDRLDGRNTRLKLIRGWAKSLGKA